MNDHQKRRFADHIIASLYNTVSGKKIAFYGWAFKKDTNDTRESAAIYVADALIEERAEITVYDPKVTREQMLSDLNFLGTRIPKENERYLNVVNDPYEAVHKAHAIAVLTEWGEFKEYDYERIFDEMLKPAFIFDGRRLLDNEVLKKQGFKVYTIGEQNNEFI
jgi:UDPglucose 6-dehydrogenase